MKLLSCPFVVYVQICISDQIHKHIQRFERKMSDILLKCHKNCCQCSQMQHGLEQDTRSVLHTKKILHKTEMPETADRQKLCNSLYNGE